MATAEQIKALVRSYSEGDQERFLSVTMQIAAHAARGGKDRLAQELREMVEEAKKKASVTVRPVPIARPRGELSGLAVASYPKTRLADMVLETEVSDRLHGVVQEYRQVDRLRAHGLVPRRRLLLIGPPGCGKTMTASALAGELSLPLMSVQLHAVITKFMGETAAKLHVVFDAMAETRGVYLFDEFDAIGSHRAATNDVGEMRRVLNSFLMFLERDDSDSLVLAATNLVEMLDPALFRRFDDVVNYGIPTSPMRRDLIKNRLAAFAPARITWNSVLAASEGLSHAEIVRACNEAAKDAVLQDRKTVSTKNLATAFERRAQLKGKTEGT